MTADKIQDLRLVLSAVDTAGLQSLQRAFEKGLVCRGRFVDEQDRGCLFHWLSEGRIRERRDRQLWEYEQPFFKREHREAVKRIVVGWDAAEPASLVAGRGYTAEYPPAEYVLQEADVLMVLTEVLAERTDIEEPELAAV